MAYHSNHTNRRVKMSAIILNNNGIVIGNPDFFKIETEAQVSLVHRLSDIMPNEVETKNRFLIVSETVVSVSSVLAYTMGDVQEEIVFYESNQTLPGDPDEIPFSQSPIFVEMPSKIQKKFSKRISMIHEAIAQKMIILQNRDFAESTPSQDTIIRCDETIERQKRNINIMLKKRATPLTQEPVNLVQLTSLIENQVNDAGMAKGFVQSILHDIQNSFRLV